MSGAVVATLGLAVTQVQLQRTLAFTGLWSVLHWAGEKSAPASLIDHDERARFGSRTTSMAHAIAAIVLSTRLLLDSEESKAMNEDRLYGMSDDFNMIASMSCGYFIFDLVYCLTRSKVEMGFVVHAVACALCYFFSQFPYLHWYGPRFLLFELSTPFLNVMLLLRQLGHTGRAHDIAQTLFGYSFMVVRIFYGIFLSWGFWIETSDLLRNGNPHSVFVVVYYMAANAALTSLNLFWFSQMLKKRSKAQ